MHCELLVPALLSTAAQLRLPSLELLLARGRRSYGERRSCEAWLLEAFGLELESPPAGALSLMAQGGDPGAHAWARADPVHLRLLRDRMVIVPAAAFSISPEEADALVATLNAQFSGRILFQALAPERWVARFADPVALPAGGALESAGRDYGGSGSQAAGGADALLNEAQMALHEHPVNEAREARGEPAINSVWLWGAGAAPPGAQADWHSVGADDPFALGLARAAQVRAAPLAKDAARWLDQAPEEGRHLTVLDGLRAPLALGDRDALRAALQAMERDWFAPLLAALRAGRAGMLTLHVPDSRDSLAVEIVRGDLRRIWRRPRPLDAWIG